MISTTSSELGRASRPREWSSWFMTAIRPFRTVLALLILLVIVGGIVQPLFLTPANLQNLLASQAVVWVTAIAMTFVLISGGLDLSVGAIATLSGVVLVAVISTGTPTWLGIVAAIAAGVVVGGGVNGLLIGKARLSVFVVTLASMTTLTGLIQLWTGSSSAFLVDPLLVFIGSGQVLGLAMPVWIMIAAIVIGLYIERFTYLGRDVFAVGGNLSAAQLSGIRTERTLIFVYAGMGAAAAIGGVIATGRIGSATAQVDLFLPLQAIAAVLVGGTLLTGGSGSVIGTALGVLFIGGLANFLSISGVPQAWQQVLTGVILVVAVAGDRMRAKKMRRQPSAAGERTQPETS